MPKDEFTQSPRRRLSTGKPPWEESSSPQPGAKTALSERKAVDLGDARVRVSMRGVIQTAPYESFETVVALECSAEVAQALDNGDETVTDAVQSAFAGAGGLVRDIVEAEMITTAQKGAFYRKGGVG